MKYGLQFGIVGDVVLSGFALDPLISILMLLFLQMLTPSIFLLLLKFLNSKILILIKSTAQKFDFSTIKPPSIEGGFSSPPRAADCPRIHPGTDSANSRAYARQQLCPMTF